MFSSRQRRLKDIAERQKQIASEEETADIKRLVELSHERTKLENEKAIIMRDGAGLSIEDFLALLSVGVTILVFLAGMLFGDSDHGWGYRGLSWAVWPLYILGGSWAFYLVVIKLIIRR